MSRTIKEIYNLGLKERNKRLELKEFSNDSKLSIMNGLLWVVASIIYSFETILDVFAIDISNTMNNRINGTPIFYVNALLQYQHGDTLQVREDGLAFGYATIDESKRIITQVSYHESRTDEKLENKLILKVATGAKGKLSEIDADILIQINAYINRMKFFGTDIVVVSRKGDILIPRLSIYFDGSIPESELLDAIEDNLNEYMMNIDFDAAIYVSKVIEAIKKTKHVTDVHIDENAIPKQGVFLASYDNDGQLLAEEKIDRMIYTSSGFIKQSSQKAGEVLIANFRQSLRIIIDK